MENALLNQILNDSLVAMPILGWAILGLVAVSIQSIFLNSRVTLASSIAGLAALCAFSLWSFDSNISSGLFFGGMSFDPLAQFLNILTQFIALCVLCISVPGIFSEQKLMVRSFEQVGEYAICILFVGFGVSVATSAVDLTSFFLGIETLSIGMYALCGFFRTEQRSTESALKYLLIGAFSTVLLLYGIAFTYGATGSTSFIEISRLMSIGAQPLVLLAIVFLIAAFAFKLALIPFHLYTPDVYEGAPTPITAFLATAVKVAAVGAGIRIFWGVFRDVSELWQPIWASLCAISILFGNVIALKQVTLKKLLAFSSISHAGFLGLGILVAEPATGAWPLFPLLSYLFVYTFLTLGMFAVLSWIEDREEIFCVEDLRGLGSKRFGAAALFSLFALGLAGIPPLAGFMVKFWIFQSLIEQGYFWITGIAVVGAIIGAGYYLRILMLVFMADESENLGRASSWMGARDRAWSLRLVLVVAVFVTVVGGLRPSFYADWVLSTLGRQIETSKVETDG